MSGTAAADEVHDLDLVPIINQRVGVEGAFDDEQVALDGDAAWVDLQPFEELGDGQRAVKGMRFAVQPDLHE